MQKVYRILSCIFLFVYGAVMLYFFIKIEALVPDEINFYNISQQLKIERFVDILYVENELGYGSIYWIILRLLKSKLVIRLFCYACLMITPISIIYSVKDIYQGNWKEIFLSLLVYFCMPLSWFTGKMIGPELIGNAAGVLAVLLCINNKKEKTMLGALLAGISTGIKTYNFIFVVYIVFFKLIIKKDNHYKNVKEFFRICLGCVFGYIISNPIFVLDNEVFKENFISTFCVFKISYIWNLCIREMIEWDLVNSGGISHIIMFIPLFILLIWGFVISKYRKRTAVNLLCVLVLLVLFSFNKRILGWYYLPLTFIIPLSVPESIGSFFIILINLFFIWHDLSYQAIGKFDQIKHVALEETIEYKINDYICNEKYHEYNKYYLVDVGLNSLKYTFSNYKEVTQEGENKDFILVISRHTLANKAINIIFKNAKNEQDGYSIEYSFDDIFILKHQNSMRNIFQ
ncbi:MAG: hypothetical protein HFH76_18375 [Lachnospiraceae bacterium]|nr:hypothetical protein [Lachnospiraceae bacterium]